MGGQDKDSGRVASDPRVSIEASGAPMPWAKAAPLEADAVPEEAEGAPESHAGPAS